MHSTKGSLEIVLNQIPETPKYLEVRPRFANILKTIEFIFNNLAKDESNAKWISEILEKELITSIDNPLEYLSSFIKVFGKVAREYVGRTGSKMYELQEQLESLYSTSLNSDQTLVMESIIAEINAIRQNCTDLLKIPTKINQIKEDLERLGFGGVVDDNQINTEGLLRGALTADSIIDDSHEIITQMIENSNEFIMSQNAAEILKIQPQEMAYIVTSLKTSGDLTEEDYIVRPGIRGKYFTQTGLKKVMALMYAKWPEKTENDLQLWASMFAGVAITHEMSKQELREAKKEIDAQVTELKDIARSLYIVNSELQIMRSYGTGAYTTINNFKESGKKGFQTECSVLRLTKCFPFINKAKANHIANYVLIEGEDYTEAVVNAKNSDSVFTTKKNLTISGILKLCAAFSNYLVNNYGVTDSYNTVIPKLSSLSEEGLMSLRALDIVTLILTDKSEKQRLNPENNIEIFENWTSEVYKDAKNRFSNLMLNDLTVNPQSDGSSKEDWILMDKFGDYVDMVVASFGDEYKTYFESHATDITFRNAIYTVLTNFKNHMVSEFDMVTKDNPFATVSQVISTLHSESLRDKRKTFAIEFRNVLDLIEKKFSNYRAVYFVEFGLKKSKNADQRKSETREVLNAYPKAPSITTIVQFRSYLSNPKSLELNYLAARFGLADSNIMELINSNIFKGKLNQDEINMGFHGWSTDKTTKAFNLYTSTLGEFNKDGIHKIIDFLIEFIRGNVSKANFDLWVEDELIPNYERYTPVLAVVAIVLEAQERYQENKEYIVQQLEELVEKF